MLELSRCKYTIKAKPTGNICELCGSLMMEGTKTIPERCSNKTCPNHNPHKLGKKKTRSRNGQPSRSRSEIADLKPSSTFESVTEASLPKIVASEHARPSV